MKRNVIILFFGFCLIVAKAQQDPQYSLYQFNQLAINPAYAGSRDAIAAIMDIRRQWAGFSGAPTTLGFSIHAPVLNNKVGVGFNAVSDQIGAKSMTGAYGNFAYIAKLNNRTKLSFGLRAGYLNYQFNYHKVTYKDADEVGATDLANTNKGALDLDAGLFLKTHTFFLGVSVTHLTGSTLYSKDYTSTNALTGITSSYTASYYLNAHLFIVLGKAFVMNENLVFTPTMMIKTVSGSTSLDLNFNFLIKKRLWLGAFVRQDYGIGFLCQVYASEKLRIGYAYDTGLGTQKKLGASHELMLGFDFGNYKAKMVSPRFL